MITKMKEATILLKMFFFHGLFLYVALVFLPLPKMHTHISTVCL